MDSAKQPEQAPQPP
jgi:hypothetical protein